MKANHRGIVGRVPVPTQWVWGLLIVVSGCDAGRTAAPAPVRTDADAVQLDEALDRLEATVVARLQLMPEVARAKFASARPVHDPVREDAVIADFTQQAHQLKVPGWLAENMIRGQLHAARVWQQMLIEDWQRSPPDDIVVRDLARELRPEIDRTTAELAASLAAIPVGDVNWTAALRVRVELGKGRPANMPARVWWLAWEPLVGPRTPTSQRRITVQRVQPAMPRAA